MKIKKSITIHLEKKGQSYIVHGLNTLGLLMGSSSVAQSPHMWNIKKVRSTWIVPIDSVRKRLDKLNRDIDSITQKKEIIEQILGGQNDTSTVKG